MVWWLSSRRKPHRIERWRANSNSRGVFAMALTTGDGARHHRNWCDFLSSRHVLILIQSLTLFFAVSLSALALFISVQLNKEQVVSSQEEESETLGVEFTAMGALGLFIALSMAQGITATVNLHIGHVGIFLFSVLLIIPALALFAMSMTDLSFIFRSYIKHHWQSRSLQLLREEACPRSPHERCKAPIVGITAWCIAKFGQTDCANLRSKGIREAWQVVRSTSAFMAAVAWLEVAMLFWCVRLVVIIVTFPLVMQSAMRFYLYVLLAIAVASFFLGDAYLEHEANKLLTQVDNLGTLFCSASVTMIVAVVVGRAAAHVRSTAGIVAFIALVLASLVLLAVLVAYALTLFFALPGRLKDKDDLGTIACDIGLYGCSLCSEDPPLCPEWKTNDIIKYAQAYVKFSGFTAIVSIPPWFVALYVAFTLYLDYRSYQSAYV